MTGVAHLIFLNQTQFDFGIAVVGETKERKLTVKNQGVTTVPLTVSTSAPFSILNDGSSTVTSSFTLAPTESREVTVQLSPTVSGDLQRSVRLNVGTVFKDIPATGKAYTEEEYRELLKQSILATCQATDESQGTRNIQFVPGPDDQDLLFYRMPCPTEEQLAELLQLLMDSEDWLPISIDQYQGFDPAIALEALQQLAGLYRNLADDADGLTPADYDRLMSKVDQLRQDYPDFDKFFQNAAIRDEFWSVWAPVLRAVLAEWQPGDESWQLLKALLNFLLTDPNAPQQPGTGYLFTLTLALILNSFSSGQQAISAVLSNPALRGNPEQMEAMKAIVTGAILLGAEPFQQAGLTRDFFSLFLARMAEAYAPDSRVQQGYRNYRQAYIMALAVTADTVNEFIGAYMSNPNRYANLVGGFIGFVALAKAGWSINGVPAVRIIYDLIGGPEVVQNVHVIATQTVQVYDPQTQVTVDRKVTVFVHVEAMLGVNEVDKVAEIIEKITQAAHNWWQRNQRDLGLGTAITVLVAFNVEPGAVTALEQALASKDLQTPVIILYPEDGQWEAKCVGNCSDRQFLDAVATALAQAFGTPYAGGNDTSLLELLERLEESPIYAQLAYPGLSSQQAQWLAYGVCGGEVGCILFIEAQIAKWLNENAAAGCQWRYDGVVEPASRFEELMPC